MTKMFWILRHTRAANFFNSLNNNCTSKANNNNNNAIMKKNVLDLAYNLGMELRCASADLRNKKKKCKAQNKNVKRPPRKAYGRLSVDSDDASSMKKIHDSYDNMENYELVQSKDQTNDIQGNFTHNDDSDVDLHETSKNSIRPQKELNENTISRLQTIAMSEDEDYDESLTCNVCDRAFHCHRQLASHQQKKRHFGCSGCDSLFPSLMLLEHHKEEFEHWSDDEDNRRPCCRRNRGDDDFTDTDSITSEAESEDMERLL